MSIFTRQRVENGTRLDGQREEDDSQISASQPIEFRGVVEFAHSVQHARLDGAKLLPKFMQNFMPNSDSAGSPTAVQPSSLTTLTAVGHGHDRARSAGRAGPSLPPTVALVGLEGPHTVSMQAGSASLRTERHRQPLVTANSACMPLPSGRALPVTADRPTLPVAGPSLPASKSVASSRVQGAPALHQFANGSDFAQSLPKGPGSCPICGNQFAVLKNHARSCFAKQLKVRTPNSEPSNNLIASDSASSSSQAAPANRTESLPLSSGDVDSFLRSLPKRGTCPLCSESYDGLKKHARKCFDRFHPPFNFSDSFFESAADDYDPLPEYEIDENICYSPKWLTDVKDFADARAPAFNVLHLNVNSVRSKSVEVSNILTSTNFDMIIFQESKLGLDDIANWLSSPHFELVRRDRCRRGGGILVFVNKKHSLRTTLIHAEFESIVLKVKVLLALKQQ